MLALASICLDRPDVDDRVSCLEIGFLGARRNYSLGIVRGAFRIAVAQR
jgi:hypothetical protein